MSKIICDVCGTSFPDTATQCPICGSVRPADTADISQATVSEEGTGYAHVKGGRFSKSNVKKRNKMNMQTKSHQPDDYEESDSRNTGLIILLITLIAIIVLLVVFVVVVVLTQNQSPALPGGSQGSTVDTNVPCSGISVNFDQITLDKPDATDTLKVYTSPSNTTDTVTYVSSDPSVATVDASGVVSYVAEGQAIITITCGEATAQCQVICKAFEFVIPPEEFRLTRAEITFTMEDESWILYSGEIASELITWTADDETVAIVTDGTVIAIGEGSTTVYGEYAGNKVACTINCDFSGGGTSGGDITEDTGDSGNTGSPAAEDLHIYAKYFFSANNHSDFTIDISVDDTLTLMLSDKNKNEVEASWSINAQPYASLSGSKVKGLIPGTAIVTATYKGQTYTCKIRIVK